MTLDAGQALAACRSWVALPDANETAHVLAAETTVLRGALLAVVDRHARTHWQTIDDYPRDPQLFAHCLGCLTEVTDKPCPELVLIAELLGVDLSNARHHEADTIRARLTT